MENWLQSLLKKLRLNESTISMLLGALVVVVVGVLIFNYFSKTGEEGLMVEEITQVAVETSEEGSIPENLPNKHIVAKGEHLWQIAEKYYGSGYNWTDIAEANNLKNPNILLVSQELTIPQSIVKETTVKQIETPSLAGTEYTVQKGDHLWQIAVKTYGDGYRWTEIAELNNITSPNYIEIGQKLRLP